MTSGLVQFSDQRHHQALLWNVVQPGAPGLRRRVVVVLVLPLLLAKLAHHPAQGGVPVAVDAAGRGGQARQLADGGGVSRRLAHQPLHGRVSVVGGQEGGLVGGVANQRSEGFVLGGIGLGGVNAGEGGQVEAAIPAL